MHLRAPKISNFLGGMPLDPLEGRLQHQAAFGSLCPTNTFFLAMPLSGSLPCESLI